jgi:hypothetical protein
MAATGVPQAEIRRCLGVGGIAEKTLRKHFREELDTARTRADAAVKASVYQRAIAGEGWACSLWLKRTPNPSTGDSFREPNSVLTARNKAGETMFTLDDFDAIVNPPAEPDGQSKPE